MILERGGGRKRERERNIDVGEKHRYKRETSQLVASCMHPDQGPNSQHRHVPDRESNVLPFSLWDNAPADWATPARAVLLYFYMTRQYSTLFTPAASQNAINALYFDIKTAVATTSQ